MLLLVILFLIFINLFLRYEDSKIDLFSLIVVLLILYAGLKSNYSYDYKNYLINFNEIKSLSDVIHTSFEKGYAFLAFLFNKANLGFNSFLLFIAFISLKLKEKSIKKISIMPTLSLLLYFLLFYLYNDVEQIRHGISIAFCLYSITFMVSDTKKSSVLSFLLICLAILFHSSAVLFLFVYLIKDKHFSTRFYYFSILFSFIFYYINLFKILGLVNSNFIHSEYLNQKTLLYSSSNVSLLISSFICKIFIFCIFYRYAFDKSKKMDRLLLNTYFLGIVFMNVFCSIPILAIRGTVYMRYAEIFMIPSYASKIKQLNNKRIHLLILFIIILYYLLKFFITIKDPIYFYYTGI